MGYGTSHRPDLKHLLLWFRSAKKHRRPYHGKHEDHGRRWPTRNGSVVSSYPKQLEWVTRTAWRVCPARKATHTGPCHREWSAEHTERCKMNQSHSDAHQGENSFGRSCAKLRKSMGLTQRELGKLLGINGQAVGQWERDKRSPTAQHLKRLLALALQRQAFVPGQEHEEAQHLWLAARRQQTDFAAFWMQAQLASASVRSTNPAL